MFTLYGRTGSGSAAVEALLDELGLAWQFEAVPHPNPESYLAINPLGQVPALRLPDGQVMTESAAMMIYLADLNPQAGLAPLPASSQRAAFLRWMTFLAASTYSADLRVFYPARYGEAASVKAAALQELTRDAGVLSQGLGSRTWFLDSFSALDIYAAMILTWMRDDVPELPLLPENLKGLITRAHSRPSVAKAFARNNLKA